jgi:hypothetical protein
METLKESSQYRLTLEKVAGQWWLELTSRPSGRVKILCFPRRDKARRFFAGMDFPAILRVYDAARAEWQPMYKPGT